MSAARALALAALLAVGCGAKHEEQPARTEPLGRGSDGGVAAVADGGAAPLIGPDDDGATATPPGSVAAWQAVIDRDRYLARRGQGAVIVGRMGGDAIAPGARGVIRWLIDETEGNGALAVRVALAGTPPAEGDRVAVRGAWAAGRRPRAGSRCRAARTAG